MVSVSCVAVVYAKRCSYLKIAFSDFTFQIPFLFFANVNAVPVFLANLPECGYNDQ